MGYNNKLEFPFMRKEREKERKEEVQKLDYVFSFSLVMCH